MASKKYEEAIEFAVVIAREFPKSNAKQIAELLQLARRHTHLQEMACNVQMKEGYDLDCEKKIVALCAEFLCERVQFEGDPRGCTVKLFLPSGRSNHWGGETWGVPS